MHKRIDKILIVTNDDNIANKSIEAIPENFEILRASSVPDALSAITFRIPSLIICDINLPNINGLELLTKIRNSIKTKLIPFIIVGASNNDLKIKSLELGADLFLPFPFKKDELTAIIKSSINRFNEFYLLSITDELTRLFNRREFIKKFEELIKENKLLSIAIIDLDKFKDINDIHGHLIGDKVLMKLAELLKEYSSPNFFPARFGGEEFVIIFNNLNILESKKMLDSLLTNFRNLTFHSNISDFNISFSGGIAEYPKHGNKIAQLLSRADQALYTAKDKGRNQITIFSPFMARNDKFWNFLSSQNNFFVDNSFIDIESELPFLPIILELVTNLNFDVKSIGALSLSITPIYNTPKQISYENYNFDIKNIKVIILKSCESIFPSDTYIGLTNFFKLDFIILFPSVVDFTFNTSKFNKICDEIANDINNKLKSFNYDLSSSSDVLMLDPNYPRKIYTDIEKLKKKTRPISLKRKEIADKIKKIKQQPELNLKDSIEFEYLYENSKEKKILYQIPKLTEIPDYVNCNLFIEKIVTTFSELNIYLDQITTEKKEIPLLINWNKNFNFPNFIEKVQKKFKDQQVIILIQEKDLAIIERSYLYSKEKNLPTNVTLGINDVYISSSILKILSTYEFKLIIFSKNITKNIFLFRERMKIINAFIQFTEQLEIKTAAIGVEKEEELQIIEDLNIYAVNKNI